MAHEKGLADKSTFTRTQSSSMLMNDNLGTFDTLASRTLSLTQLMKIFNDLGVETLLVKALAANDNSKNQIYLASHLTQLSQFSVGPLRGSNSKSQKQIKSRRGVIFTSETPIVWVDASGRLYPAPHTKLIYYPQYPEVRLSGFLRGSSVDAGRWMNPCKSGRVAGRWLVLGAGNGGQMIAYLVTPDCSMARELEKHEATQDDALLHTISISRARGEKSNREKLIDKLCEIHELGWIAGQKLDKNGKSKPYRAMNGGGYTLEAKLGVCPNGVAEPDYLGYEVKQFGVSEFPLKGAKPTTLMTPEPDGGEYVAVGFEAFIRRYGYVDKSGKPDRINFGGLHRYGKRTKSTGLTLSITGYDEINKRITNASGAVTLLDDSLQNAASWSFEKLVEHWEIKHALAVYVPCCSRKNADGDVLYSYGKDVEIGTGTVFPLLLSGFFQQFVYYDPGMKLEKISTDSPVPKRRSQFRIHHRNLNALYRKHECIDITTSQ